MPATQKTSRDPSPSPIIPPPPTVQGTFDDLLPVGLKTQNGKVRRFEPHEHTAQDLRIARNRKSLRTSPVTYMMRMIALGVESLGGQEIYSQFKESGFKTIPKVLQGLHLSDGEYLLVAGQIHSYGSIVEGTWQCPVCEGRQKAEFDLSMMEILKFPEGDEEAPDPVVTVELDRGNSWNLEAPQFAQYNSVVWKYYTMAMPTLASLLQIEKITLNDKEKFDNKVLARSTQEIIADDGVTVMPKEMKSFLGDQVIEDLTARDVLKLQNYVYDYLPRLDRELLVRCLSCGHEGQEGLNPTILRLGG